MTATSKEMGTLGRHWAPRLVPTDPGRLDRRTGISPPVVKGKWDRNDRVRRGVFAGHKIVAQTVPFVGGDSDDGGLLTGLYRVERTQLTEGEAEGNTIVAQQPA